MVFILIRVQEQLPYCENSNNLRFIDIFLLGKSKFTKE